MKKGSPAVKYGLIGAFVLVCIGILFQVLALSYLKKVAAEEIKFSVGRIVLFSLLSLVLIVLVFVIFIVKSVREYRQQDPDYTYRKLAGQGLIATLLIVVVSTGISYLYGNVIAPESKQKTIELSKQVYQKMDMPDDQKEKMMARFDNPNPVRDMLTSVGLTLLLGTIISLISASVLNRRNTINPNQLR